MDSQVLVQSLSKVTKEWTKQRKQEERNHQAVLRRDEVMMRSHRMTILDAAYDVMHQAYMAASANNTLPAHARQIMYAARDHIQRRTGRTLNDQYFTQTLVPNYLQSFPNETADWDVVFDARGHFIEPHTNREVPLGTLAVRDYLNGETSSYLSETVTTLFPTLGPKNRFNAILFLEKEGFMPLLQKARLAQRYDIAIMSTKGVSSTAARQLVDQLCSASDISSVPLLILRDFDKAGFTIAATLQKDTQRYQFENLVDAYDLGLRLADVQAYDLPAETVSYGKSDPQYNLRENGATEEEIAFLCQGQGFSGYRGHRVELNAFTSDKLLAWIEDKLQQQGIKKVIPDFETLTEAYQRALTQIHIDNALASAKTEIQDRVKQVILPKNTRQAIDEALKKNPADSWDDVLLDIAKKRYSTTIQTLKQK
ncbi:MAG: hypothetical protein KDK04_09815 [Candidatus Competibacteraceae bacterium]|nr:hypothetical protein [Candidatus Competibacteraceae bacterium]